MIVLDIESERIEDGVPLLPLPVGCAVKTYGQGDSKYWAWGHPEGNNCTKEEFKAFLESIWGEEILTFNGDGFDLPVLAHHFDLPPRDPSLNFDALFGAYLYDPHARSLRLKDIAENWLGIAPDEQQDLYDWIMENVPECRSRSQAGAYISKAPAGLVAPYAVGDITRTEAVWDFIQPHVEDMKAAFDRERHLAPILSELNHRGVRVDMPSLRLAHRKAVRAKSQVTRLIRKRLGKGRELDLGKNAQLGAALLEAGFTNFLLTPKAKEPSMSGESLARALESDPDLRDMLACRARYEKLISGFLIPWIRYARVNGGRLHSVYNQVRTPADEDGNSYGTRTGRLSCVSPNLQQVAKPKKGEKAFDYFGDPYPNLRAMLLPEEGHVWVSADFKNQEPRITAHFESGQMMAAFINDPLLDPYIFIRDMCSLSPDSAGRDTAKVIFLGLVYGMGKAKLAAKLGISEQEAGELRWFIKQRLPDVVSLDSECKEIFKMGGYLVTLGGRHYFCEPSADGRTWEYKALNTLIQGSAGDQTKEATIYVNRTLPQALLLSSVHDELNYSCPPELVETLKEVLNAAANHLPIDVPMIFDIGVGANWSEAK